MSNKNVPKLRFPEFRGKGGEWEDSNLGTLCFGISSGKDKSDPGGVFDLYGSTGIIGKTTNHSYSGSCLLVARVGANAGLLSKVHGKFGVTDNTLVVDLKEPEQIEFIYYLLLNYDLNKLIFGSGQPLITGKQLKELSLYLPEPKEQQKVADCLSSIDELLTAQTQKIDALKAHKKGLMQQFFPAEDETVPKLRFPEFREAGEWISEKFGEICEFVRGPFGGALKKDIFVKEGYAVYEQSHAIHKNLDEFRYYITKEKYEELKRFSLQANDLIMSCSGTMGKFAVIQSQYKEGVINQALLKLTIKKGYNLDFVKHTLEYPTNQEKLLSQSAGGAIKNVVGVGQLKEIELPMPELLEQQKIAGCLSSIDDLITAQTQKLDALKAHKKGLMQQLFPSVDEVGE